MNELIIVLLLACLTLLVMLYCKDSHDRTTECPCCHKQSLLVVQQCKSCQFIRTNNPALYRR